MEDFKNYFKNDIFIVDIGIELLVISPGYAKVKLEVKEKHLNALKTVQRGVLFTLADIAFAAAINAYGNSAVLINANMSFVKAATKGTLIAEAKETSISPKIATYNVDITDDNGDIIAIYQGMGYRKKILNDFSSV